MGVTLDIARLSPAERLALIGELWDSLAPEDVTLSSAQTDELGRRMADFDADQKSAVAFEDIEAELDRRA